MHLITDIRAWHAIWLGPINIKKGRALCCDTVASRQCWTIELLVLAHELEAQGIQWLSALWELETANAGLNSHLQPALQHRWQTAVIQCHQ
jgi:hypothetical protein